MKIHTLHNLQTENHQHEKYSLRMCCESAVHKLTILRTQKAMKVVLSNKWNRGSTCAKKSFRTHLSLVILFGQISGDESRCWPAHDTGKLDEDGMKDWAYGVQIEKFAIV